MATIGSIAVNIVARTEKFTKGIMSAQSGLVKFGKTVLNVTKQIAMFGAGVAAAGAAALTYLVKGQFEAVDALAKTSDRLGIATEKLAGLRLAAEESGVSTATLEMALQRMVRRIAEAAQGTGEAQGALKELGLNAAALNQLSPDEQFRKIAGAMSQVSNQGDRVRLSMKLFDSEGVALVNTLKLGTAGLDEADAAAERLGLTVSRKMAAAVERANDAFGRLKMAIVGLARQLAVRLAPIMEMASKWLEGLLTSDGRIHKWANAIAKAIGFAIEVIIRAIHDLRINFHRMVQDITETYLKIARSPMGDKLGLFPTQEESNRLTGIAADHGLKAKKLELQNPGADFNQWFNGILEDAFNTTTPEAKKPQNIIGEWAEKYGKIGLQGIGKFLGESSNVIGRGIDAASGAFGNGPNGMDNRGALTLTRAGTAESYRQRRRIERQGDPMTKIAKENAKDNKRSADGIWKLVNNAVQLIPSS